MLWLSFFIGLIIGTLVILADECECQFKGMKSFLWTYFRHILPGPELAAAIVSLIGGLPFLLGDYTTHPLHPLRYLVVCSIIFVFFNVCFLLSLLSSDVRHNIRNIEYCKTELAELKRQRIAEQVEAIHQWNNSEPTDLFADWDERFEESAKEERIRVR